MWPWTGEGPSRAPSEPGGAQSQEPKDQDAALAQAHGGPRAAGEGETGSREALSRTGHSPGQRWAQEEGERQRPRLTPTAVPPALAGKAGLVGG